MGKRVQFDLVYDASVPEVYAMLGDQSFREQVCDATGVLRHTVTIETSGEGMEVVMDQVQSAHGLPSFATRFVGNEINIVQRETWHGVEGGALELTIPGKPGQMRGTVTLKEMGGMTTEHVDLEVKVGIPLFGGKIEGLIGDMLIKSLKVENDVGRSYLMG